MSGEKNKLYQWKSNLKKGNNMKPANSNKSLVLALIAFAVILIAQGWVMSW